MTKMIFKILTTAQWSQAQTRGVFEGAPIDRRDGYIHFSDVATVRETAAKHFAGEPDLLLAAIEPGSLGDALKWEVSRGGALFPHLYAPLPLQAISWIRPLPLGEDGVHRFPSEVS